MGHADTWGCLLERCRTCGDGVKWHLPGQLTCCHHFCLQEFWRESGFGVLEAGTAYEKLPTNCGGQEPCSDREAMAGKSLRKMGDCGDRNDNHFGCSSRYRDGRKHAGVERRAVETLGMPWTTVE
ncbi:uncharacterized protein [Branchiostoma lanceolatum]|uniref:uncharacterized protein n=1 Tax=Branchiostoma lanceolatum TaxID=7740 RepID=UPI003454346C